jgi:hypothetical protein
MKKRKSRKSPTELKYELQNPLARKVLGLGRELRPVIQTVEPILVELVCDGCGKTDYRPILAVGMTTPPENLDRIPDMEGWDEKSLRHVGEVFSSEKAKKIGIPSGYAFCGIYHVVRLWRWWDGEHG